MSKRAAERQFDAELREFNRRLSEQEPFSLVRFGDGEMKIVQGEAIDLLHKYNGEHRYTPGDEQDEQQRKRLIASLHYRNPRYFVGIACPCCVGMENFQQLKTASKQPEEQLTWANLFVNSNNPIFRGETVPILARQPVSLVCHERAHTDGMPMAVKQSFRVGANAWLADYERVLADMDRAISDETTPGVYLFSAGVLSNLLIHALTERHPGHSYIDVGSVFDVELGLGATRSYLKRGFFKRRRKLRQHCVWA